MKIPPFITELIKRIASKNPKFFQVIQAVSATVAFVAFIPDLCAYLEIASPAWLEVLHNKAVKLSSLLAIVIAQLPNETQK